MAKIKTLRRCTLFRELSYRELAQLAPKMREETAKPKALLAEEGKPTRGLIILKSGRVRLTAGKNEEMALEMGPGDFFGELALADGDLSRQISAQVVEACEFLRLDPKDFHALQKESPDVAGKIATGVLASMVQTFTQARQALSDLVKSRAGG